MKKLKKITTIILVMGMMVTFIPAITSSAYAKTEIHNININSIEDAWNEFHIGNTEYAASVQLRDLFSKQMEAYEGVYIDTANTYLMKSSSLGDVGAMSEDTRIDDSTKYFINFYIQPREGYKLADDVTLTYNGHTYPEGEHRTFKISCSPKKKPMGDIEIRQLYIDGFDEPMAGHTAATRVNSKDSRFHVKSVAWSSKNDSSFKAGDTFVGGRQYTITITLDAKSGFSFGPEGSYTGETYLNGDEAKAITKNSGHRLVISKTYNKMPKEIKAVYLTFDNGRLSSFYSGQREYKVSEQIGKLQGLRNRAEKQYELSKKVTALFYKKGKRAVPYSGTCTTKLSKKKVYLAAFTIGPKFNYDFSKKTPPVVYLNSVKIKQPYAEYGVDLSNGWTVYLPLGTLKTKTKPAMIKKQIVKARKRQIVVNLASVKGGVSYQIAYKQGKQRKYKLMTSPQPKVEIQKLKPGKKYYVKARVFKQVGKKTYYGKWTKAKAVRVK